MRYVQDVSLLSPLNAFDRKAADQIPDVRSNMTNPFIEDENIEAAVMAQHPLRGIGIPEHVSRIAVFLASDDARWVTGSGVVADGGFIAQ